MAYADAMAAAGGQMRRRRMQTSLVAPAAPYVNFNDRGSLAGAEGAAQGTAAGYGNAANASYYNNLENFDASSAIKDYATGAWGSISEGLNQTLDRLKGESVGAGRFDSGFFDQDQGQVVNTATGQLANSVAQQAVTAAGMQQRNNEAIGAFGAQQQGIGNDLLVSRREELENNYREEQERKRKRRSGIGGAIGGVLGGIGGFIAGGPAGAAGGYKAGTAIGGAF